LKVLVVPSWYPSIGSELSGIFVQDQAEVLSAEHDVAVLYPTVENWRVLFRGVSKWDVESWDRLTVARPTVLRRPRDNGQSGYHNAFVRGVRSGSRVLERSWGRPDVVHAHVAVSGGWAACAVADRAAVPLVLTEHSSPFSARLTTESDRRGVDLALNTARLILPVGETPEAEIKEYAASRGIDVLGRMQVLGNVVRTDYFGVSESAVTASPPLFLTVSVLSPQKDIASLLRAARLLLDRRREFRLVIGGDGPLAGELQGLCRELGLGAVCEFAGQMSREQVRLRLQSCTALVSSSVHESFGIAVAEAMACGARGSHAERRP